MVLWAGCANNRHAGSELVVGSGRDPESMLLAGVYLAALRSYGFAARSDTADDPMAGLDSGAFTVVPVFTGQMLQRLRPGAAELSDAQVYRSMVSALPEGVAAGDYTTAAEDKPVLLVTGSTAQAWGGKRPQRRPSAAGEALRRTDRRDRRRPPGARGDRRLPTARGTRISR